jgi:hypothetical protein
MPAQEDLADQAALQVDQTTGLTILKKNLKKAKSETSAETQQLLDEASKILHSNDKPVEEPVKEEVQENTTNTETSITPKAPVLKPKSMIKTGVRK